VTPAGQLPAPQAVAGPAGAGGPRPPGEARAVPSSRADPGGRTGGGGPVTSPPPEDIPLPPRPAASAESLSQYLGWLDGASGVLDRRIDHHEVELEQLGAQWTHVVRNLGRLRPEEVTSVVEGQARLREALAADRALRDLMEIQRRQVIAWAEVVGRPAMAEARPSTDEALVGRLLDDVAAERARTAAAMLEVAVEAIAGVVLDLEVVRREGRYDPGRVALGLVELRQRLAGVADGLRQRSQTAGVQLLAGEPLPAALRRLADAHRPAVRAGVAWSGPEVVGARAGAAVPGVVLECLQHLADAPGAAAEVAVHVDGGGAVVVRILTDGDGLLAAEDAPWLVRARARAALAGGRLLCGRAGSGSLVDLRLP
jgi:hypothetical protein